MTDLVYYIDPAKVTRTYNGKVGCMCGCLGTYSGPNTKATKMRVSRLNKLLTTQDYDAIYVNKEWVSIERNGRNLTVYFCD